MCEKCVAAQRRLDENRERIEEMYRECRATLAGSFSPEEVESLKDFDPSKPFMVELWKLGCVALKLASVAACISGTTSSIELGHWAGTAMEVEIDLGEVSQILRALLEG